MPSISVKIPLTKAQYAEYDSLTQAQKNELYETVAEHYNSILRQANSSYRRKIRMGSYVRRYVNVIDIPPPANTQLPIVAKHMDCTPTHVVRIAICDFLGFPEDHINRMLPARTREHPVKDSYSNVGVYFKDGESIGKSFDGSNAKQAFREYLNNWCAKHPAIVGE